MRGIIFISALVIMVTAVAACSKGPEPIRWGIDMCDQCRMILGDKRFAAELVADRIYKFDGVDELARFQAAHPEKKGSAYVTDADTGELIPAPEAVFLRSSDLTGPMGGNIIAFANRQEGEQFASLHQLPVGGWLHFRDALAQSAGDDNARR